MRSLSLPELRARAARVLGTLAGNGNEDALEVLLNPDYGVLVSTTVSALQPAADRGNQPAIFQLRIELTGEGSERLISERSSSSYEGRIIAARVRMRGTLLPFRHRSRCHPGSS